MSYQIYVMIWGFSANGEPHTVLIWYYYLIESVGHFSTPVWVEVAVNIVDHLHTISDALRDQVQ